MDKSNETTGISIQDLEQWFNEELELYGSDGHPDFDGVFIYKYDTIAAAKLRILDKAKRKILEQEQAKLNLDRLNKVLAVLCNYDIAEEYPDADVYEIGAKCLNDIVRELNEALE
jgi:hypothetical protein